MGAAAALKTGTAIAGAAAAATWTRPYSQSQKEIESLWLIRSWGVETGETDWKRSEQAKSKQQQKSA